MGDYPEKKGVGLNPQSQIHYTDHLAVVCIIMGIPLIFIDDLDYAIGKAYYPDLIALRQEYDSFNPDYLAENYDVLFMSDLWDRNVFRQKFRPLEEKYHKTMRNVHCPHGFSDKGFYLKKCANEDIALIYGQNMIDQLKHFNVFDNLNQYVITGNYRYTYYKENQEFYNFLIESKILKTFPKKQPIILYAPTWMDLEESTTFFDAYSHILEKMPPHYNMLVKLHPRLELDDAGMFYHIVGKYEESPNIRFLKDFPLVYPLLAYTDIYLGDMSSVGYDFLPFNKPMFFLNKQNRNAQSDRGLYLFRCGVEVKPREYEQLYQIIEQNLANDEERFGKTRREVYHYTFGEERPFSEIKKDIIKAYNS